MASIVGNNFAGGSANLVAAVVRSAWAEEAPCSEQSRIQMVSLRMSESVHVWGGPVMSTRVG